MVADCESPDYLAGCPTLSEDSRRLFALDRDGREAAPREPTAAERRRIERELAAVLPAIRAARRDWLQSHWISR